MHKVVVITGGFDPIHSGHLNYISSARELGDTLVVGVNSDEWLARKKGQPFMPFEERVAVMEALGHVDYAIPFDDRDGSAKDAIAWARRCFPESQIIFANGGDRSIDNIPEMDMIDDKLEFVFGVGGTDKVNSSSWILTEWKNPKTDRPWGYYRILHENGDSVKLKELTVEPRQTLSMQRHKNRSELWFVTEGTATLYSINNSSTDTTHEGDFPQFSTIHIPKDSWHQLSNNTPYPLKIIEIQYGTKCVEEDIQRQGQYA